MADVSCCGNIDFTKIDLKCMDIHDWHINYQAQMYIANQEYLNFEKNKFDNISKWLKKKRDSYGNNI